MQVIFKMKIFIILLILTVFFSSSCTWQDAAKVTANSLVYSAMITTGNGGDWNMNADLAGQAAEEFIELTYDGDATK